MLANIFDNDSQLTRFIIHHNHEMKLLRFIMVLFGAAKDLCQSDRV